MGTGELWNERLGKSMGIRFECPNGHRLHVKNFLAGKRGICPDCDARFIVPAISGRRAEAVQEVVPQPAAPVVTPMRAPAIEADLPEINISAPRHTFRQTRRDQRIQRAKAMTMALSLLVLVLLGVMVLVLVR